MVCELDGPMPILNNSKRLCFTDSPGTVSNFYFRNVTLFSPMDLAKNGHLRDGSITGTMMSYSKNEEYKDNC